MVASAIRLQCDRHHAAKALLRQAALNPGSNALATNSARTVRCAGGSNVGHDGDAQGRPGGPQGAVARLRLRRSTQAGGLDWFTIDGLARYEIVGRDGAGGVFALYGPQQHVLLRVLRGPGRRHRGEPRRTGDAAARLSVLADAAFGRTQPHAVRELRRAAPIVEEAFLDGDDPENEDYRAFVRATLDLPLTGDAIKALHHAVTVLGKDIGRARAGRLGPRAVARVRRAITPRGR